MKLKCIVILYVIVQFSKIFEKRTKEHFFFPSSGSLAALKKRSRTKLMDLLDSLSTYFLCFQSFCLLPSIFPCFVLISLDLLCGSLHCVQGCYPPDFLNAWDNFNHQKGSENDRPGERE